ncbi:MAG: 2-oxoglutarate dehydrogenase complex dihydrolipoyllysine-residue succinyltransferase [Gammaproteobacteria bacterium]|jgi:2-oxoglutarate dehydrogenase E2 component (dihydrolipoamide succinyltransferase)|nr:2-oxoglutarate dehydrogenase complex dihydrolipoyllysine-residue succinyltransferase [Gammaproteobacteria bacterium]
MQVEIKVPQLPESVTEGTLGDWHKQVGDMVAVDENIVDLETDKVVLEIVASKAGAIESIAFASGDTVKSGDVLGVINTEAAAASAAGDAGPVAEPVAEDSASARVSPAVRKMLNENDLNVDDVQGTGKKGAILKADVEQHLQHQSAPAASVAAPAPAPAPPAAAIPTAGRNDRRVPMSRLRAKIAERLKQAQNTAAMLTTFNEVNLKPLMDTRAAYRDAFEKAHGVKLGMMSFFTAASVEALKRFPAVNASVDGSDIVYHDYFDIGIAVSSERGLVVPILRDADQMSYAEIEQSIRDMGMRARDGKLGIEELTGGTFSITNGGIFGSMLSTPILNPPQSAILGMHSIQQRAVVIDGEIVARPMMYLALSYDHRIVDGKDAVQFLVTIKNVLEDPARLLLGV